ncbi:MAG: tetratricopeptide repeat protein [Pirellula sp.]
MHESKLPQIPLSQRFRTKFFAFASLLFLSGAAFSTSSVAISQETKQPPAKPIPLTIPDAQAGEEDFEEACRLRLNVDSIETLKEIIGLAESALKKGLDAVDAEAAKKMIASSYVQKTRESIPALAGGRMNAARKNKMINEFIEDLGQAIKYDPTLVDAYLFKSELLASRNELQEAFEVADAGIEKLLPNVKRFDAESKAKLSKLLMMRAGMRKTTEDVIADLKLSVQANPNNLASMTILKNNLVQEKKVEEAIDFFRSVLESSPENEILICYTAELMATDPKRITLALELLTDKIRILPKSTALLKTRAKVHSENQNAALAKADMDLALSLTESDVDGLLMRAKILMQSEDQTEDLEQARKDVDAAIEIDANRADAVLLRSMIATKQLRFGDAINDIQTIIKALPKDANTDPGLLMQLGVLYSQDNRPTQAIKVFDQVIKADQEMWEAYRLRGDTRLSIGDHSNAILDFEKALKYIPKDDQDRSGILNNLSWVLSTTPIDNLRNGKQALEYAEEACKLTNYEKPHILSTLAAAHAELGDFDKAVEWSKKCVELAKKLAEPQTEQMENELKSYLDKKPWREKTETKENKAPIGGDGVDT